MELTNWKTLFKKEAWGDRGSYGIEVRVAIDREFTENDKRASYKIGDDIEDAIMRESARTNPEQIAERDAEKKHFTEMFPENMVVLMEPIPNQYCSRWCCEMSPWYKVTTPKGIVTLGWRKRVINITYELRVTGGVDTDNLFPDEQPTKGKDYTHPATSYIHAYGYDKAKQYLAVILGFYTPEK
jgi:hypothetical protein